MTLKDFAKLAILTTLCTTAISGCNVGNAPSVDSPKEVEANFQKEDPQEQIKTIQNSPASAEKKAELIKAIETKYGIKAGEAGAAHGTQTPGAPATPPATN